MILIHAAEVITGSVLVVFAVYILVKVGTFAVLRAKADFNKAEEKGKTHEQV